MEASDPMLERTFRGHTGAINSLAWVPTMKQLVSGGEDGMLMIWNFKPQLRAYKFLGHKGAVYDVACSPDGRLIASASKDRTVRLWLPSVMGDSQVMKGHGGAVRSVDFSWDGTRLLTSSDDKTIKLWSLPSKRFISTFSGHSNWVRCARFNPDGRVIVSGSDDKTVRLWDVERKRCLHAFYDHEMPIYDVGFHPDGTAVAACSGDHSIKLWDTRSHSLLQHYPAHAAGVSSISFHPSGNYILSSSKDGTLKTWDVREGRLLYTMHGHNAGIRSAEFSPSGEFFASAGGDRIVMVWSTNFDRLANDKPLSRVPPQRSSSAGPGRDINISQSDLSRASQASSSDVPGGLQHSAFVQSRVPEGRLEAPEQGMSRHRVPLPVSRVPLSRPRRAPEEEKEAVAEQPIPRADDFDEPQPRRAPPMRTDGSTPPRQEMSSDMMFEMAARAAEVAVEKAFSGRMESTLNFVVQQLQTVSSSLTSLQDRLAKAEASIAELKAAKEKPAQKPTATGAYVESASGELRGYSELFPNTTTVWGEAGATSRATAAYGNATDGREGGISPITPPAASAGQGPKLDNLPAMNPAAPPQPPQRMNVESYAATRRGMSSSSMLRHAAELGGVQPATASAPSTAGLSDLRIPSMVPSYPDDPPAYTPPTEADADTQNTAVPSAGGGDAGLEPQSPLSRRDAPAEPAPVTDVPNLEANDDGSGEEEDGSN